MGLPPCTEDDRQKGSYMKAIINFEDKTVKMVDTGEYCSLEEAGCYQPDRTNDEHIYPKCQQQFEEEDYDNFLNDKGVSDFEYISGVDDKAIEFCNGDNNGESHLSAQYSDWVEVQLRPATIEFSDDYTSFSVLGVIPILKVFQNKDKKWISYWGDCHEFDEKDIIHDEYFDEHYLKDVDGKWTFQLIDDPLRFDFEEIDATEV